MAEPSIAVINSIKTAFLRSAKFSDFGFKNEILEALNASGSTLTKVQEQYIPKALFGLDVLCETGTAAENRIVYILTTLQKLIPTEESNVMVICESHEATLRVLEDYNNLSKSMPNVKIATFTSASTIQSDADKLRAKAPNIVIGTAERVFELLDAKILSSENTKQLILDECHSMLEQPDMSHYVQKIFYATSKSKQVMMFSSPRHEETRSVCRSSMPEVGVATGSASSTFAHKPDEDFAKFKTELLGGLLEITDEPKRELVGRSIELSVLGGIRRRIQKGDSDVSAVFNKTSIQRSCERIEEHLDNVPDRVKKLAIITSAKNILNRGVSEDLKRIQRGRVNKWLKYNLSEFLEQVTAIPQQPYKKSPKIEHYEQ